MLHSRSEMDDKDRRVVKPMDERKTTPWGKVRRVRLPVADDRKTTPCGKVRRKTNKRMGEGVVHNEVTYDFRSSTVGR